MKRSEVIKHIREFDIQYSRSQYSVSNDYWDSLLTALETLELLPPLRELSREEWLQEKKTNENAPYYKKAWNKE